MDMVRLGRTNLMVSAGALGTGGASRLGKTRGASPEESIGVVHAALDAGVTIFDSAYNYGTEELLGAGLKGARDRVVVSTKLPIFADGTDQKGNDLIDRAELVRKLDTSLSRLGTDYVDILHLHGVCPHQYDHVLDELLPELIRQRDAGKIRFLALAERFQADTTHRMLARAIEDGPWDVIMIALNVFHQRALDEVLPRARELDIGVMCMYAVRGKLASVAGARQLAEDAIARGELDPGAVELDDLLGFLLGPGGGASYADACYRFCRHAPGIDTVLTGTGRLEHLADNLASINAPALPSEMVARARAIFGRVETVTTD